MSVHDVSNIYHVPLLLLEQSELSMSAYKSATSDYCIAIRQCETTLAWKHDASII